MPNFTFSLSTTIENVASEHEAREALMSRIYPRDAVLTADQFACVPGHTSAHWQKGYETGFADGVDDAAPDLIAAARALLAQHERPHGFADQHWFGREVEALRGALSAIDATSSRAESHVA